MLYLIKISTVRNLQVKNLITEETTDGNTKKICKLKPPSTSEEFSAGTRGFYLSLVEFF